MRARLSLLLLSLSVACSAGESSEGAAAADASASDAAEAGDDATAPADDVGPVDDVASPGDDASGAPDAEAPGDTAGPDLTALDQAIGEVMTGERIPGVAVALVQGDRLLLAKGYGLADVDEGLPVTQDTAFMLASVSKTVVAMAALLAVDDGAVDLDTDIDTVLPFSVRAPAHPETPITLRMLLTHTSGLTDDWDQLGALYVDGDSTIPLGTFLEDLLTPAGAYYDAAATFTGASPGTAYDYSNVGAALAAFVVESATGIAFETFCEERLFGPLGMTHTGWRLADLQGVPLALPYAHDGDAWQSYGHYGYPDYPDGGLRSSVADLSRLLRMVIGQGVLDGVSVLPAWAVAEMLSDLVPSLEPGQGLIWYSSGEGDELYWGHEGGDSGVSTTMYFRPTDGVGAIVLTNIDAPESEESWGLYTIEALLYDNVDMF